MRILIHDYAGHPFLLALSRALSNKGYIVDHVYFAGDLGPKGHMKLEDGDSKSLTIHALGENIKYSKSNFFRRFLLDKRYGNLVKNLIEDIKPDIVFCSTTPIDAQEIILKCARKSNIPFIFWCQDLYSLAVKKILKNKLSFLSGLIGNYYEFLEKRHMTLSSHVIVITEKFFNQTDLWHIEISKISFIPNWGDVTNIKLTDRNNDWAIRNQLSNKKPRVLYTGTLGFKHNPELLIYAAKNNPKIEFLIIASGVGMDYLKKQNDLPLNIKLMGLQPFKDYSKVLSTSDILIAMISEDAGEYSAPSKILSYLCIGKAILLSAPKDNYSSNIIINAGAGKVFEPNDIDGFSKGIREIIGNESLKKLYGSAGKAYADSHFDINSIVKKIEIITNKLI